MDQKVSSLPYYLRSCDRIDPRNTARAPYGRALRRWCTAHCVPPDPAPIHYNVWFEAYLCGKCYVFGARHNIPRIDRILVARGGTQPTSQ